MAGRCDPVTATCDTFFGFGAVPTNAGRYFGWLIETQTPFPLLWETLDPMWLDRAVAWLDAHGRKPYIALERWEEAGFRSRFGGHAELGQLDWPPRYEIDRVVRIYDPADRKRSLAGERVVMEYVWPELKK